MTKLQLRRASDLRTSLLECVRGLEVIRDRCQSPVSAPEITAMEALNGMILRARLVLALTHEFTASKKKE